ncbi:tripartite tricarboxylate transporter substrate binding protein [Ottowia thiooxydans]|uniref:tripartite tricarboxylate transporter substrate binding protein n=1 Tax=Ottowia thiooxydans TaxID=219182 RepID=UPI0003F93642|nr:tripartite tricarboxylate transporter substrate binding protein [Ottowia thiooxydans]
MSDFKNISRRTMLAAGASALLPLQANAQAAWPTRPIKLVVPFTPGGSNDILSRVLGAKLSTRLGHAVVIENKGGGGGTLGTDFVAKSAADGYTLLFASTSVTTNAASGKKLPYDLFKDLQPIGLLGATPFVIVVGNQVKANTLAEFLALARATPKAVNYGTAGIGGINHLGTELFASAAKIEMTHVPYKGIGHAFTDLMGGSLQMTLPTLASVLPHIRGGKMRALAITSAARSPLAPEIPTAAEAGLADFQLEAWYGLLGPANMPAAVVSKLNTELNWALTQPDIKEAMAREAATTTPGTPEQFTSLMKSEVNRWSKLITEKNIQID